MHLQAYMDFWRKIVEKYENEWLTSFYFEKNDFFFIENTNWKWFINSKNVFFFKNQIIIFFRCLHKL